jgi:hypothetical protein
VLSAENCPENRCTDATGILLLVYKEKMVIYITTPRCYPTNVNDWYIVKDSFLKTYFEKISRNRTIRSAI